VMKSRSDPSRAWVIEVGEPPVDETFRNRI